MPRKIDVALTFPPKFAPFMQPNPWKVAFGGRGSGKTESIAKMLLFMGTQRPLRIICCREYMASIKESSHLALADAVDDLRLSDFYEVQEHEIKSKTFVPDAERPEAKKFTTIRFSGIRNNPQNLKSAKGIDICWIDEADAISHRSMEILIPTVHRKGQTLEFPEIWISFNPHWESDLVYKMFVTENLYPTACVVNVNWRDNPWFPPALQQAREQLLLNDPDAHEHVYEGKCKTAVHGAVYRSEIAKAEDSGQFTDFEYDSTGGPVEAFFDIGIGRSDATAVWLAQRVGPQIRLLWYFEFTQKDLNYCMVVINQICRENSFFLDRIHLPHDARKHEFGTGMSAEEVLRKQNYKVSIGLLLSVEDGINAVRSSFPNLWFNVYRCQKGIDHLRSYHYQYRDDTDKDKGFQAKPVHDSHSHAADALRYLCLAFKPPKPKFDPKYSHLGWDKFVNRTSGTSWMNV